MPGHAKDQGTAEIFRDIFDMSPDSIVIASADGTILLCNRKAYEISGYTYEELIGRNSLESVAPEELPRFKEEIASLLQFGELKDRIYTYIRKDGSRIPIEFTVRWFDDFPGIGPCSLTIGRDITSRLQFEKAYKTLLENILYGILVFQNGQLVYANPSAQKSLGYSAEELTHFSSRDFLASFHQEDAQIMRSELQTSATGKHPVAELQFRLFDKTGQLHWISGSSANITYNGQPALQVSLLDITSRKEAQIAERATAQRYQALAEASPEGIYIIDKEEHFVYINEYGARMMGLSREEIIGHRREKFFPAHTLSPMRKARQKAFATGKPVQAETEILTSQGKLWFNVWYVPLPDEQGQVAEVMGIARDVTEQKRSVQSLKNDKQELEQRVAERTSELLASQEQLKLLAKKIVTTQEDERRRVARELHNEAGQELIILKLDLASLRDELVNRTPDIENRLAKAMSLVDRTTNHIRDLSHSLHPPVLDIAGINLSLEEYCGEFATRTRIPVTYEGVDIPNLPEEFGITLYRILQEALTNVAKHARATVVHVTLERVDDQICLKVSDNGQGFDEQAPTNGIGLVSMRERLGLLGGKLKIETALGKGTSLFACINWEEQK